MAHPLELGAIERRPSVDRRSRGLDAVGCGLIAVTAAWAVAAASGRPGADAEPVVGLAVAATGIAAAVRLVHRVDPTAVPRAVALAVAGAFVLGYPDVLRAGGAPTGYANANATLAAIGVVACLAAAPVSDPRGARRAWFALAGALAVAVLATGSNAGCVVLALAGLLAAAAVVTCDPRVALGGGVIAVSLALGITVALARGGDPIGLASHTDGRVDLWEHAAATLRREPVRGVGPGVLGDSPEVDADLRWTHHGYLQQAAEQGLVGLALLLALIAWAYARLWSARRLDRARAVAGSTALTVVAVHAAVDHVLHHPAVTLTLVAMVGWATAPPAATQGTLGSPHPRR